jgi:hypothetical protein
MDENLLVNVIFNLRDITVSIPKDYMIIDLIEELIDFYSLPTDNYTYSLYIDENDEFDFIETTSCFWFNQSNQSNEIDYLPVNHYLHEYIIYGTSLHVKLICEYKYIFNIKQILRQLQLI